MLWGFLLWLFGYVLGFVFYAFVPKPYLGWVITPFGVAATCWVLLKKMKRETVRQYVVIGVPWAVIAIVCDYLFLVLPLHATDYYKLDVYLYYGLTFLLPIAVGWFRTASVSDHK